MAIDKIGLKKALNDENILNEEKQMWYRAGFYIYPHATEREYSSLRTVCIDAAGTKYQLPDTCAAHLRQAIIEWWQAEKLQPRAKELGKQVEVTPFDELEIERG